MKVVHFLLPEVLCINRFGVTAFLPEAPLAIITSWSIPVGILAVGIVTIFYTWVGGLRAVVWVDVVQLVFYLLGAVATIVVALASLFLRRLVRSDVAMTGEISLRGRVLRVGGIKEKVMAAARSGLKQVILPEQNRNDWLEVPNEVREKMQAHFVKNISELINTAVRPK